MQIIPTPIPDLVEVRLDVHRDPRGYFVEAWRESWRRELGCAPFVQDNHSSSTDPGVLRGLHYQRAPKAQAKLVRVARGRAWDVAVDLREGSPTFGRHHAVELSAADQNMLFVPRGFAHGFLTLEPETHVCYKLTEYYAPRHEGGVRWDDPALAIEWPMEPAVLSERDRQWPDLAEIPPLAGFGDR